MNFVVVSSVGINRVDCTLKPFSWDIQPTSSKVVIHSANKDSPVTWTKWVAPCFHYLQYICMKYTDISYWVIIGKTLYHNSPRRGRQHSFVEIDHEIFSTVILSLPLIQEGQLSVSGERMCTILVNRLEDKACPVNVWLGKLTTLDMTPMGWLGHKTSTQIIPQLNRDSV